MEKKKNEKKKNTNYKTNNTKFKKTWHNFQNWTFENQKMLIGLGIGLLLGIIIMIVTEDEEIATLKDGTQPVVTLKGHTITADDLYNDMKDYYSVGILLNTIDDLILKEKYKETDEMNKELENTANQYYSMYENYYQTSREDFLANNGFASHSDFIEYLRLDYRRNEAVTDYVKSTFKEEEIKDYYDKNVHGDINSKHILVKPATTDEMKEDEKNTKKTEANNLALEIINKLNSGKTFDEVKEEYKDSITYEELGFQPYNAKLETSYLTEMKNLEVNTYSKKPVETSYGYHIVYKIEQKEKPSLDDVKDTILEDLYQKEVSQNTNLLQESLFKIREINEIKFADSVLEEKYNEYKANILK